MRTLSFILLATALAACASDHNVAMKDPRTGETAVCRQSFHWGLDPWSQTYGCVTEHVTQGWVTVGE